MGDFAGLCGEGWCGEVWMFQGVDGIDAFAPIQLEKLR
jgi:hypothetical protein